MRIEREFFERDTLCVAQDLIGQVLVRKSPEGITKGIIVETEAYMGDKDAAAHSYKRKTDRVRVQFGPKGAAYIYLIYGMYHCLNITSGKEGVPEVILIRAIEPIDGIELMKQRRKTDKLKNLCSGPGKLCKAMDIDMNFYGADLCKGDELYIEYGEKAEWEASKRINIDYAGEAADYLWRFTKKGSPFVSK